MANDHQAVIAAIVEKRTRGSLPLSEWGPKCHGCGGDEFRIDGYCSIECRDYHDDEDIATLAAALASLTQRLQDAERERDGAIEALDRETHRLYDEIVALRQQLQEEHHASA